MTFPDSLEVGVEIREGMTAPPIAPAAVPAIAQSAEASVPEVETMAPAMSAAMAMSARAIVAGVVFTGSSYGRLGVRLGFGRFCGAALYGVGEWRRFVCVRRCSLGGFCGPAR